MNEMLVMSAEAALKQTPASLWDTMGWNWYIAMAKSIMSTEEEKLVVWKSCIDGHHNRWTRKYRDYAKTGGMYAEFFEEDLKKKEESDYSGDLEAWSAVRLKKVERLDGLLRFFTEDNETFEMPIADIYSQSSFRQAFTVGSTIILPPIKQTSYQKFIESLKITKIENIGATLMEKLEEIFELQRNRLSSMELENEEQALESVENKSFALYKDFIYFRISSLMNEVHKDHPSVKQSSLFSLLRDIGAENIKYRKFNFWKYDLGTENRNSLGE